MPRKRENIGRKAQRDRLLSENAPPEARLPEGNSSRQP